MPQTKVEITRQFAESLQRHLAAAGMSGYELAKRAGVAEGTVYGCISGRTALRLTTLYKLAQALGVTACALLEGPPPPPEAPWGEQPTGKAGENPPTDRAERAWPIPAEVSEAIFAEFERDMGEPCTGYAMDESGWWYPYGDEPTAHEDYGEWDEGGVVGCAILSLDLPGPADIDWRKSWVPNPAHKAAQ